MQNVVIVSSFKGNVLKSASNDTFKSCNMYRRLYGYVACVAGVERGGRRVVWVRSHPFPVNHALCSLLALCTRARTPLGSLHCYCYAWSTPGNVWCIRSAARSLKPLPYHVFQTKRCDFSITYFRTDQQNRYPVSDLIRASKSPMF